MASQRVGERPELHNGAIIQVSGLQLLVPGDGPLFLNSPLRWAAHGPPNIAAPCAYCEWLDVDAGVEYKSAGDGTWSIGVPENNFGASGLKTDLIAQSTAAGGVVLDLTSGATGVSLVKLTDNLAAAWTIKEGTNAYLTFVTTDNAEAINATKRLTTTDGVASGTARVVGGRAASDTSLPTATNTVNTILPIGSGYTIPANTLKTGSKVVVYAHYEVTTSAGATTLTFTLTLGGATVQATSAVDTSLHDKGWMRFEFMCGTAGAGAKIYGSGTYIDPAGTTVKTFHTASGGTSLDTTSAQVVLPNATWSANGSDNVVTLDAFTVEIA